MRAILRRAFAEPARGVLRLLLCAISAFAVAGSLSAVRLLAEADGPAERFDAHAATQRERTYRRLGLFDMEGVEQLREMVPGVRAISPYSETTFITVERGEERFELNRLAYVSPDYFSLGDVRLVTGDHFGREEVEFGDRVALISVAAAELIFPDGAVVGRELRLMPSRATYRIVGVYERSRTGGGPGLLVPPPAGAKFPTVAVAAMPGRAAEVRRDLVVAARDIYAEELSEAGYPVGNDFLLNSAGEFGSEASPARRTLVSLALIGVVSLIVAGMGVFSTATVEVAQRQRAIGLQRALGASRTRVVASLVLDAVAVGAAGAVIGALLAALVLPSLEPAAGMWAAVSRTNLQVDLVTAALAVAVIGLLSLLATVAPALQAVRLAPVAALRES